MQSIRLLESQSPIPQNPTNAPKYEPWDDIQFTGTGGVASLGSLALASLSSPGASGSATNGVGAPGGPSDTAAIAPWMLDDGPGAVSLSARPLT